MKNTNKIIKNKENESLNQAKQSVQDCVVTVNELFKSFGFSQKCVKPRILNQVERLPQEQVSVQDIRVRSLLKRVESPVRGALKYNLSKLSVSIMLSFLILIFFLSTIAFAIPNSLTLQGKLTNPSGASQQGTYNFTFRIYDAFTNGNILWELTNFNITTDANGVYDVILKNINLSFADQYYLGITISADNESTPRINLTSSPYSFRANISEGLNANNTYAVKNPLKY